MKNLRIKCDMCDWSYSPEKSTISEVKRWHNILCPKCLKSILITDKDIAFVKLANHLSIISRILHFVTFGFIKIRHNVYVDSAGLNT